MVVKNQQIHTSITKYYKHNIPPTCFGHSRGSPQGNNAQMRNIKFYIYFILFYTDKTSFRLILNYTSLNVIVHLKPCIFKT